MRAGLVLCCVLHRVHESGNYLAAARVESAFLGELPQLTGRRSAVAVSDDTIEGYPSYVSTLPLSLLLLALLL
jgi:hypothetical protein